MAFYENKLTYPVYLSNQELKDCMDLLLMSNDVYMKNFNRFMCRKAKNRNQQYFSKCCFQCFSSEEVLIRHRENCLITNGKQSVELKSGLVNLKNLFKQLPVPFKIYADFECILKNIKSDFIACDSNGSYTRKYQDHIP